MSNAAISTGTRGWPLIRRHILPSTTAPVIVQATYAAASAIISAAILIVFLGVGTSTDVPSWGGMMADARPYFPLNPIADDPIPAPGWSVLVLFLKIKKTPK